MLKCPNSCPVVTYSKFSTVKFFIFIKNFSLKYLYKLILHENINVAKRSLEVENTQNIFLDEVRAFCLDSVWKWPLIDSCVESKCRWPLEFFCLPMLAFQAMVMLYPLALHYTQHYQNSLCIANLNIYLYSHLTISSIYQVWIIISPRTHLQLASMIVLCQSVF